MFRAEWKGLFKNKFMYLVFVALVIIPTLYVSIFLSSMWDPYGKLEKLPVAVVNLDNPVLYEDKEFNVGDDLVEQLKDGKNLDFKFVSQKEAKKGLNNGEYYMVMTIPEDFSKNATTLTEKQPKEMIINYETSKGHNYIASKMSTSAINEIRSKISENVTEIYTKVLLEKFGEIHDGMKTASDGSDKLLTGTDKLYNGSEEIKENLDKLATSSLTFVNGTEKFSQGLSKYIYGTYEINTGIGKLSGGANNLYEGISRLDIGGIDLKNGIIDYTNGVGKLDFGIKKINENLPELENGTKELKEGSKKLSKGLNLSLIQI